MVSLNLQNIEDLIFYDQKLRERLTDHKSNFRQWEISKTLPGLKTLGRRALLDVLNNLSQNDLAVLRDHFNDEVTIDKLDSRIVKSFDFDLESMDLDKIDGWIGNFCLSRDADNVYLTFWR